MHVKLPGERFEFPTVWDIVRDIRRLVSQRLAGLSRELRNATEITVGELAENLAKYAEGTDGKKPRLELLLGDEFIEVRAENRVASPLHASTVLEIIHAIEGHPDPTELYANAIEDSMSTAATENRQGFYRIAAVGGFKLTAEFDDKSNWLSVRAKRSMT